MREEETDVLVIGSGFGGSVAALRFAEAGRRVVVLERGDRVTRDRFRADLGFLWKPDRHAFGMHDLQVRGDQIITWVGAAVGGGSQVFSGTLKRLEDWDGFPSAIRATDMTPFYERAEAMMGGAPYPAERPYQAVHTTQLMLQAGARLRREHPDLIEDCGPVHLAISFAPPGRDPGTEFVNEHGATQRYYDPREQSILGGDIDTKNSLDRNYLWRAEHKASSPVTIRPLCEAETIEPTGDGRWRVGYVRRVPAAGGGPSLQRLWRPSRSAPDSEVGAITTKHLVVAAGAVGSSELLLRQRESYGTLDLGEHLGRRYTTNGDYLTLMIPFRGLVVSWLGFLAAVMCVFLKQWVGVGLGLAAYFGALWLSPPTCDPDKGPTNSDSLRVKGRDGRTHGGYIESGRYPTPGCLVGAILLSVVTGHFRPGCYRWLVAVSKVFRWVVPPFGALARTYPIPLLSMGRDDAFGTFRLVGGRAVIDYDVAANREYYAYLEKLGRMVSRAANAFWLPDLASKVLGRLVVPHNQGGLPMGEGPGDGVVDHAGRVFGCDNLMVLDGSIIPVSVGPNPALTILALSERATDIVLAQVARDGRIHAEPAAARERA